MNRTRTACIAAAALISALAAQSAPPVTTIQLAAPLELTGTLVVDVDGDGLVDLVLACHDPTTDRRELRVHRRREGAPWLANEPSSPPYRVEKDVVAFTFADVEKAPGRELVLCTPEQVVAVVPGADGAVGYVPLAAHRLVWPAPNARAVLPLPDACVDLDGDGRDDLLLPGPDGAAALLRGRDVATGTPCTTAPWRSPLAPQGGGPAEMDGNRLQFRMALDDGPADGAAAGRDRGPLLAVEARAPHFVPLDADGDGRLDLLAVRNGALWCWRQGDPGTFAARPAAALPLPADRLALFDPAFDVRFATLDGDAVPDLVLTTSAKRGDEIEVRIDVHRGRADGGWDPAPTGRLRLQTLATAPQLVDADGDGRVDLVAVTVRTDRLRGLTGGEPQALDAQLNVFRGDGGKFATPALLTQLLPLPVERDGDTAPFVRVLPGRDGNPGDVLLRADGALLRRPLRRDGDRLQLAPATTRLPLDAAARLQLVETAHGEVLVTSRHELLHVRMR